MYIVYTHVHCTYMYTVLVHTYIYTCTCTYKYMYMYIYTCIMTTFTCSYSMTVLKDFYNIRLTKRVLVLVN